MTFLSNFGAVTGAFGDTIIAEETPVVQLSAQYGITSKCETFTATGEIGHYGKGCQRSKCGYYCSP